MNKFTGILLISMGMWACGGSDDYVPKPHGYPRMEFPEKKYVRFDSAKCPYSFEMPRYSTINRDTNAAVPHPNWYNLNWPEYNATLHLTYYKFTNWDFFDSLVFDTRKLVNKHLQKADDIIETRISDINPGQRGIVFSIVGNTATNYNFYTTDSVSHFLRGALYFNQHTVQDSIAPAFQFIKKDVEHLIQTLKWK